MVFDGAIIYSSRFLDGVRVFDVGLGACWPEYAVFDFGIAFLSLSFDVVGRLGVGLSARGPIDQNLRTKKRKKKKKRRVCG